MKKTMKTSVLKTLLMMLSPVFVSCTIGSVETDSSGDNGGSDKLSISFTMPNLKANTIVDTEATGGKGMQFTSSWDNNGHVFMFAKQNGKIINIGRYPISAVNSSSTNFKVEIISTGQFDSKASYQLYGISGAYNVDNGSDLFYRVNLSRNEGFNIWFSGQKGSSSVAAKIPGVVEQLYVINKSDKPIQFVHKGYDTAEKWYYTTAEVSVEDGHIQNAEQGNEAVGKPKEIAVFNGQTYPQVPSYYVPNGKKIKDAQLIAEIDGKEVRSVNRISSDITLQSGNVYAIFAVWDGEKLTLGDGDGEPVVHISSDTEGGDYSVMEIGNDETITIKTTKEKMPKVGDILASGPTKKAPYGFLCRVDAIEEVTPTRTISDDEESIIAKIKKGLAYLDEVLPDNNKSYTIKLDELLTDYSEDSEGNRLKMLSNDEYRWVFPEIPIPIYRWKNKNDDDVKETDYGLTEFKLKFQPMIDPKELTFFFNITNGIFTKYGVTFNYKYRYLLNADVDISYDFLNFKDHTLCEQVLTPIVIPAGIPIVITPKFEFKFTANIGASLKASLTLADLKGITNTTVYYRPWNPKTPFFSFESEETNNRYFLMDDTNTSIKYSGYLDFTIHPVLTFGLYGSNLTEDVLGGGFRIDNKTNLNAKFEVGYNKTGGALYANYDGYEVTDEASMEIGNIGEGSVYLSYMKIFSDGHGEVAKTLLKNDDLSWNGKVNLFYSSFKDVEAKIENTGYITFRGTKRISLIPFIETDCGFCYTKEDPAQERWTFISANYMTVNPKYRNVPDMLDTYPVRCDLPIKDLEPNATYIARPYVVSNMVTKEIMILRKPVIRFRTDNKGQISNTTIEDIPGTNLAPRYLRR